MASKRHILYFVHFINHSLKPDTFKNTGVMKTIIFIKPQKEKIGLAAKARLVCFEEVFNKHYHVVEVQQKIFFFSVLRGVFLSYFLKNSVAFLSTPPFRGCWLIFFANRYILDIRDGWSLQQKNGYGGEKVASPLITYFTEKIEKLIGSRASVVSTVSPGLVAYWSAINPNTKLLINGLAREDLKYISSFVPDTQPKVTSTTYNIVCAGQLFRYGIDLAITLIHEISEQFREKHLNIICYGDLEGNQDFQDRLPDNVSIFMNPAIERNLLLRKIAEADGGLIMLRTPEIDISTKLFDYMGLKKPIYGRARDIQAIKNLFPDYFINREAFDISAIDRYDLTEAAVFEWDKNGLL